MEIDYNYLHNALDRVEHTTTIDAFHYQFHSIKSLLAFLHPEIPEYYFAVRFVYGLQADYQKFIFRFQPTTILAAYKLALIFEESLYLDYFPEMELFSDANAQDHVGCSAVEYDTMDINIVSIGEEVMEEDLSSKPLNSMKDKESDQVEEEVVASLISDPVVESTNQAISASAIPYMDMVSSNINQDVLQVIYRDSAVDSNQDNIEQVTQGTSTLVMDRSDTEEFVDKVEVPIAWDFYVENKNSEALIQNFFDNALFDSPVIKGDEDDSVVLFPNQDTHGSVLQKRVTLALMRLQLGTSTLDNMIAHETPKVVVSHKVFAIHDIQWLDVGPAIDNITLLPYKLKHNRTYVTSACSSMNRYLIFDVEAIKSTESRSRRSEIEVPVELVQRGRCIFHWDPGLVTSLRQRGTKALFYHFQLWVQLSSGSTVFDKEGVISGICSNDSPEVLKFSLEADDAGGVHDIMGKSTLAIFQGGDLSKFIIVLEFFNSNICGSSIQRHTGLGKFTFKHDTISGVIMLHIVENHVLVFTLNPIPVLESGEVEHQLLTTFLWEPGPSIQGWKFDNWRDCTHQAHGVIIARQLLGVASASSVSSYKFNFKTSICWTSVSSYSQVEEGAMINLAGGAVSVYQIPKAPGYIISNLHIISLQMHSDNISNTWHTVMVSSIEEGVANFILSKVNESISKYFFHWMKRERTCATTSASYDVLQGIWSPIVLVVEDLHQQSDITVKSKYGAWIFLTNHLLTSVLYMRLNRETMNKFCAVYAFKGGTLYMDILSQSSSYIGRQGHYSAALFYFSTVTALPGWLITVVCVFPCVAFIWRIAWTVSTLLDYVVQRTTIFAHAQLVLGFICLLRQVEKLLYLEYSFVTLWLQPSFWNAAHIRSAKGLSYARLGIQDYMSVIETLVQDKWSSEDDDRGSTVLVEIWGCWLYDHSLSVIVWEPGGQTRASTLVFGDNISSFSGAHFYILKCTEVYRATFNGLVDLSLHPTLLKGGGVKWWPTPNSLIVTTSHVETVARPLLSSSYGQCNSCYVMSSVLLSNFGGSLPILRPKYFSTHEFSSSKSDYIEFFHSITLLNWNAIIQVAASDSHTCCLIFQIMVHGLTNTSPGTGMFEFISKNEAKDGVISKLFNAIRTFDFHTSDIADQFLRSLTQATNASMTPKIRIQEFFSWDFCMLLHISGGTLLDFLWKIAWTVYTWSFVFFFSGRFLDSLHVVGFSLTDCLGFCSASAYFQSTYHISSLRTSLLTTGGHCHVICSMVAWVE